MPKKKVAEVITRFEPGGTYSILTQLFSFLSKKYDITLIAGPSLQIKEEIEEFARDNNIKIIWVKELTRNINPLKDLFAFIKLYFIFKKGNFDIVHTHTSKAGITGRCAAKLAKARYVIHSTHGHVFFGYFSAWKSRIFVFFEKFAAKYADKIITLSDNEINDHLKLRIGKKEQFISVQNGINFNKFQQAADKNRKKHLFNIPSDKKVITVIARLELVKGHIYFLEAVKELIEKHKISNVKVLLAGDGTLRQKLENMVNAGILKDIVVFLSFRKDIQDILSASDLIVLPSLNEGFGLVLVEAAAAGVPVIATNVGGIPEVIEDNKTGILVPPADSHALAGAMLKILKDESLAKRLAEAAKKMVHEKFNIERMFEEIENIYEKI